MICVRTETPQVTYAASPSDPSRPTLNLDRLADALFLFDEIRSRLDRSGRTGTKKEDGREEGVA